VTTWHLPLAYHSVFFYCGPLFSFFNASGAVYLFPDGVVILDRQWKSAMLKFLNSLPARDRCVHLAWSAVVAQWPETREKGGILNLVSNMQWNVILLMCTVRSFGFALLQVSSCCIGRVSMNCTNVFWQKTGFNWFENIAAYRVLADIKDVKGPGKGYLLTSVQSKRKSTIWNMLPHLFHIDVSHTITQHSSSFSPTAQFSSQHGWFWDFRRSGRARISLPRVQ